MTLKDAALGYARAGLPVFPVNGKIPRTGRGLLDATTDEKQVAAWWDRWPDAGIGLPTGKASGRIVVDIDPRHDGEASLLAWEKANGQLPYTLTTDTGGGGCHFHYLYPEDLDRVPNGANVLGKGVDVRGDGGYVVVPPSPHPSGTPYSWQDPNADMEMPPESLVRAIMARGVSNTPAPVTGGAGGELFLEGGRNVAMTRLAGKLRRAGLETAEIKAALDEANRRVCDPPLPDKEIATIAASIGKREGDPIVGPGAAQDPGLPLVDVGADELAAMDLPPREYILEPVFQEKNIVMIFAERGMGKTLIGVGWGLAIAGGTTFLRWTATRARRVLYIDGELPVETLQKRVKDVAKSAGLRIPAELRFVTPDLQPGAGVMPNIATPEGQARLLEAIDRIQPEVVFLDNLSTLVRGGEENDAESWQPVQDFLVALRTRRISSVMLHHTGKAGTQRGTSKREDVIDLSVQLTRPEGYETEQGARMEITYTKARDPHGDAVRPFEAWLDDHEGQGNPSWKVTTPGQIELADRAQRILDAVPMTREEAASARAIEAEAGVKNGSAMVVLKELKRQGLVASEEYDSGRGVRWWRLSLGAN